MSSKAHLQTLPLHQLAIIYFKMGANAFGGWSTTYLLVEKEFSLKRKLLKKQQLQAAIASGQALPGPTQIIIVAQTGYYLKSTAGAFLAAFCYLLPSILATLLFSFIYFNYLADTNFTKYTIGLQAAVGGIILGNAYRIAKNNVSRRILWLVVLIAVSASYILNIPSVLLIFGFGIIGICVSIFKAKVNHG